MKGKTSSSKRLSLDANLDLGDHSVRSGVNRANVKLYETVQMSRQS